tara:strand:+ start:3942 stop:4772 length:831 start_codon:yes stop_codon:yes gene_type:complete
MDLEIEQPQSTGNASRRSERAFTMIEVALSLGIVAFALVAIIGILPTGLKAQQQNREETIIAQDGVYLMEAIRAAALSSNLNVLTQNLVGLFVTNISVNTNFPVSFGTPEGVIYTPAVGAPVATNVNNPLQVILQMCRPNFDAETSTTNHVFAVFKGFSGNLSEIAPDPNAIRFQYRVDVELSSITNVIGTTNFATRFMMTNLYNLKLRYRWPARDNGQVIGLGERVMRTQIAGRLQPYMNSNGLVAISAQTAALTNITGGAANHGYFIEPVLIGR